jgi:hypothetical protein
MGRWLTAQYAVPGDAAGPAADGDDDASPAPR